jgi:hypothetical protein
MREIMTFLCVGIALAVHWTFMIYFVYRFDKLEELIKNKSR